MFKVQSLTARIVFQFTVILLPLVAVLIYATSAEAGRVASVSEAQQLNHQLVEVRRLYKSFTDGAADAVDLGRLTPRAMRELRDSAAGVERAVALEPVGSAPLRELSHRLREIVGAFATDPTLANLLKWREAISQAREHIETAALDRQQRLDAALETSNRETAQTRHIVFSLSLAMLLLTIVFIVHMVRNLSIPLNLAVEMADRIAAGRHVEGFTFDPRHDLGNLLASLKRMHASLLGYEADVERKRIGLEQKIRQLAASEGSLMQAQRAAKLGSWRWEAGAAGAVWSAELDRIVGRDAAARPATLRTFLRAVEAPTRKTLLGHFRSLLAGTNEIVSEHGAGDARVVHHQVAAEREPSSGALLRLSGTLQDITDRQLAEQRIRQMAMFDSLTGLANRQHFSENLKNAVAHSKRHGGGVATLFIDLDRFKRINDTLGHSVGDALLCQAAQRLLECVRESDTVARPQSNEPSSLVARLGGDEFTVLLRDVLQPRDAAIIATRMVTALEVPFLIDGNQLVVTASIGIAMHPTDGDNADDLVKAADAAMYHAKSLGRNTVQFYSAEMNTVAFEKLTVENELRLAVERPPWVLHYQPKVDATTGEIAGVEALIRWNHPTWGLVPPARFISVAEEIGLIAQIGDWVLEDACRQVAEWKRAGLGEIRVAVNLAAPSFRKANLVRNLKALIERYGIHPSQLQIEATESMLMEHAGMTLKTLHELHALGVRLSIDDFGTGYSSLSYLRRFPVDQLKIDRSFVTDMASNPDDAAITGAIISLGRNMKREVVAEGVETLAQAKLLLAQGCHVMQGFLFSRPVPAAEMEELLRCDRPYAWAVQDIQPRRAAA